MSGYAVSELFAMSELLRREGSKAPDFRLILSRAGMQTCFRKIQKSLLKV